ncbi:protein ITPRID1 isoform X2 [Pogoniulus pusillus]|uniref:protein ITPRID1 isoform X2 n=1 Tax=Pogoniulus pusillus TaxID=488313 RepID=UPI0030B98981
MVDGDLREEGRKLEGNESRERTSETSSLHSAERFRQLEVLDHVTNALSSLLTNVNTQQTKAQEADRDEASHLDATRSRLVGTRVKRRRISQLLKRASQQTVLLKPDSVASEKENLSSRKEQPYPCADIAERGAAQAGLSAHTALGCLTWEETLSDKGALAYPKPQHPQTPLGKAWNVSLLAANQPLFSPVHEAPAKDTPRKEPPLLVAHALQKVVDLNCKLPNSFEMEEIRSFEDETLAESPTDITSEMMVTRTSSCQSDSSGFMEELPEPAALQNPSLLGNTDFLPDVYNQEVVLSYRTVFPMLNQDFQQKPDDCVAQVFSTACKSILTLPRSMEAFRDQGEETLSLLSAENGNYPASHIEPQTSVQEVSHGVDKEEDTSEWNQVEKHRFIKEQGPVLQSDPQDDDPSSSTFDYHLHFTSGHKKMNTTFCELSDLSPAVITESKIRGEDEGEAFWTENDIVISYAGSAPRGRTGPCWGVEVVSKDGTPLEVDEVANERKFCQVDADSKSTRCFPKMGLPEALQWGSAAQTRSSAALSCALQVSQRHLPCLVEGSGLNSSEDQETGSMGKILGANKAEQGDTVQNGDMPSAPLKSVTVQMSSRLEFTSRGKSTGQNAPLSENLAREDPVDFSDMITYFSEGGPLTGSNLEASKNSVKQISEASSQTDIPARKLGQPALLSPAHTRLTKSASLDSMLCGKHRSHCWAETSGAGGVQGSHCCHCCCCCHGCCPRTCPVAVSAQHPAGCCSNDATTELQLLKRLTLLQDTAARNLALCPLHEMEVMKSSCQHFQEKLDEIERHMTEQQELLSGAMPDEGRKEGRHLQLLRRAVRQEAAELECWLGDGACRVRESILMQLDQLLAEQSHLFSELGLSDWKGERKAQNKQAFPDPADTACPQCGHSKPVLQRVPSKYMTATGLLSASGLGAPSRQFPTRATSEPNLPKSSPWELSTSKKEMKRLLQENVDFKFGEIFPKFFGQ